MRNITSIVLGAIIGIAASLVVGLVYISILHEPGEAFYPFAACVFIGGPILGGTVAALTSEQKLKAFVASSGAILGVMLVCFFVTYAALPQFSRVSVQLPESCNEFDGSLNPPPGLVYTLPDARAGIVLTENAESAVVATIDGNEAPFSSTVYLVRESDNQVLTSMHFDNDVITASIDKGTVYIFNDKLGYLMNERTGAFQENFLLIDNYGGLSETDRPIISRASSGNWYLETTGVISSWNIDGTVKSRPHLTFSGIARGCYVSGITRQIMRL
jgi:hypothetical protein